MPVETRASFFSDPDIVTGVGSDSDTGVLSFLRRSALVVAVQTATSDALLRGKRVWPTGTVKDRSIQGQSRRG